MKSLTVLTGLLGVPIVRHVQRSTNFILHKDTRSNQAVLSRSVSHLHV